MRGVVRPALEPLAPRSWPAFAVHLRHGDAYSVDGIPASVTFVASEPSGSGRTGGPPPG